MLWPLGLNSSMNSSLAPFCPRVRNSLMRTWSGGTGVWVGIKVAVAVPVTVGVRLGVAVSLAMGVKVGVTITVSVAVEVAVGVLVSVSVAGAVSMSVAVAVTVSLQTVCGLDRFCGLLGLISFRSAKLLLVSWQLPNVPPDSRS